MHQSVKKNSQTIFFQNNNQRGNKLRVACQANGAAIYENKSDIEKALRGVIFLAAAENKITEAEELRLIVEYARAFGGFSNKFNAASSEEGSYSKSVGELEAYIKKNLNLNDSEAKTKAKAWRKFSKEIQDKNAAIGIYSGREKNLKRPIVGLRAAFALDLVGDDFDLEANKPNDYKDAFKQNCAAANAAKESCNIIAAPTLTARRSAR